MKPKIVWLCLLWAGTMSPAWAGNNTSYNPAVSLILDGLYTDYQKDPGNYTLSGFDLGGETAPPDAGFALGESELVLSSNIDSHFYGRATLSIASENGETVTSLEEAYAQTLDAPAGVVIKFGRFYSNLGYLNRHHSHTWDFADAPLVYNALTGGGIRDDGLQFSYLLPTDLYVELSGELLSGNTYPAGGNSNGGVGASMFAVKLGGDISDSSSWTLGLSRWNADKVQQREDAAAAFSFDGSSAINAYDLVYKWAPNGNMVERNFHFILEYLDRKESGDITDIGTTASSRYDGKQSGWYAQAVYQFMQHWSVGVRRGELDSNNRGDNGTVLDSAGLGNTDHKPYRNSAMLQWKPSEFSRIRLQYNDDHSSIETNRAILLQYTFALGSHGAHQF